MYTTRSLSLPGAAGMVRVAAPATSRIAARPFPCAPLSQPCSGARRGCLQVRGDSVSTTTTTSDTEVEVLEDGTSPLPRGALKGRFSRKVKPAPASPHFGPPLAGSPATLGASLVTGGEPGTVNFAVFSGAATGMSLCLFTEEDLRAGRVTVEVELDPETNRTGDVWHVALPKLNDSLLYGYRAQGTHQDADEDAAGNRFDARRILLDPYAKGVISRRQYGELGPDLDYESDDVLGYARTWPQAAATLPTARDDFDWEGDKPLNLPMEDLVVYECHVRGFTQDPSSGVSAPGTYRGVTERLDYLQDLGVNALELLPVFEFNELEYYSQIPGSDAYRFNFWGYSTVNFFSPMARFSAAVAEGGDGVALRNEFKTMVREAHKRGIEVILDVVFNHTAEGNEMGPSLSFRGLDNRVYYMLAPGGEYYNYSGCGNTMNCNQPVVRQFILDCLKYWVEEYHIDGFRFDLASILTRAHSAWYPVGFETNEEGEVVPVSPHSGGIVDDHGSITDGAGSPTGTPLADPALIEMASEDPILRNTKLIAEAWDCDGLNQVGAFPHYGNRWSEWNGGFRDTLRNFIKGQDGFAGDMAAAICGSPNTYASYDAPESDWWGTNAGRKWRGGRLPTAGINFVTAHDGFTLADMVMYNEKHNMANGENNNDGESHNLSWNCGEEGPTENRQVDRLRTRQKRNAIAALLLSQGVPMLLGGDEYGHTKGGNNNTYCHDSNLNWMDWNAANADEEGLKRFTKHMIKYRLSQPALRQQFFLNEGSIQWHGVEPHKPDWNATSRLVAFTLNTMRGGQLYIAFNTSHKATLVELPPADGNRVWQIVADTSKTAPYDFLAEDEWLSADDISVARGATAMWTSDGMYPMLPYSCVVLEQVLDADAVQTSADVLRPKSA